MAERLPPPYQLIDRSQLEHICQQRFLNARQRRLDDAQSKREEIEMEGEGMRTNPYGIHWEQEGAARDVWYHILERVKDPSSIKNLWKVSEMFRDQLRHKYIEAILPDIIKLIKDTRPMYLLRENFPVVNNDESDDDDDYYIERLEPARAFLRLRLVSKMCKTSVESHGVARSAIRIWSIMQLNDIYETINMDSFNENEFYPWEVSISEDGVGGNSWIFEVLHESCTAFLGLAGKRIRNFAYRPKPFQGTREEVYGRLREWVALMPNLKTLCLDGGAHYDPRSYSLEETPEFPLSPSITKYQECFVLPLLCTHRILEACPNIEELIFPDNAPVRMHSVQALASLKLTKLHICPYPSLLDSLNLGWKLNELILYRNDWMNRDRGDHIFMMTITSSKLFVFLEQFEDTLEHLEINVDVENDGVLLRLCNLKIFKWKYHSSFLNLNFLFPAEKLETIQVDVLKCLWPPWQKFNRITRVLSTGFMGIDIGKVFPCLKWAEVRNATYTLNGGVKSCTFWKWSRMD